MKFVDRFGTELFEMRRARDTGRTTNEIAIDRAAWLEYTVTLTDGTQAEVEARATETDDSELIAEAGAELERLKDATRTTTGGGEQ